MGETLYHLSRLLPGDGESKVYEIAGGRITANEDARYPGEDLGIQYI